MPNTRNIHWKRIVAEGGAIVVSILLAFWIDAVWDERLDRSEEQVILASLLEEFRNKKETLENTRKYNEGIRAANRRLLDAAVGAGHNLSEQTIDQLLADIWWYNAETDWQTAALNSLMLSGDLNLISNTELRYELSTWLIRFDIGKQTVAVDTAFFYDRFLPFLSEKAFLAQIVNVIDHAPGVPESTYDYGENISTTITYDHSKLLSDRKFQNLLVERSIVLTDLLQYGYGGLDEDLDAIIGLLEEELAK